MKNLPLIPYHLFRFNGTGYIFDIKTNAILGIDEPAYDVFSMQLENTPWHLIEQQLTTTYGEETAHKVLGEVQWLADKGLFTGPITTYDDIDYETFIRKLTGMSTNKIELTLAEACNLRCRYCYIKENNALNNGLMSWDVAKHAVDFAFVRAGNAQSVHITLFGGEPLLNKPVLRKVINYSQKLGIENEKKVTYSLTTNATLLDDEIINLVKKYNIGLMISLDGPRDVQDHMRPFDDGRGSFDIAEKNINKLMRRRKSVTVRSTLSNHDLDRPRIIRFLEDFGFTRIAMSRCTGTSGHLGPYDIGPEENAVLRQQDEYFLDRIIKQLEQGQKVVYNPWATALRYIHNKQNHRIRCGVGRGCTTVGIDGNLYPCHRYVGMENYVLGNIETGIDRNKFAAYLQSYIATKKKCEECWAINICGGYCPWYVSNADGTNSPPQDWWCDEVRNWLEQGVWLYDTLSRDFPDYFKTIVGDQAVEPILR